MNHEGKSANELITLFHQELKHRYPDQEIRTIIYLLFSHLMGWSRASVQLNRGNVITAQVTERFLAALSRLSEGEPIQYIIGSTEFCGLTIQVRQGVLIPRPETEELAVMIARDNQPLRSRPVSILDIGTGSGCLALSMKKAFPLADVTGIDRSETAVRIAGLNAESNNLQVDFRVGDILDPGSLALAEQPFIIISNPPYIPESERVKMSKHVVDHEPACALFVPDSDPLMFYRAIAAYAGKQLKSGGRIYLEIHEDQGEPVVNLFRDQGFQSVDLFRDFFGKNRFVRVSALG